MMGFGFHEADEGGGGRLLSCYRPPVPPLPSLDDVWPAVEHATAAVGAFDRALSGFRISGRPVPGTIGRLFARLDAVHSSGAEGATTTFTDLLEYETSLNRAPDPQDAGQVAACADAFEALQGKAFAPKAAILEIHRRLFERVPDPHVSATAGHWKRYANCTADYDSPNGMFFYTRPGSVDAALDDWERFTLDTGGPELVRQALSHWMFEHIHPVDDGNGRVGRLLVPLVLKRKSATDNACCFLGEAVHSNKDLYVDGLKRGRLTGDLAHWTRLLLSFAAQTAERNLMRLERLGEILGRWQAATAGLRSHSLVHRLVPWVLTRPAFTVRDALAGIGAGTFASMNTAIGRLAALGLIEPANAAGRERLFAAPEVIALFDSARNTVR
ncbi:Fic family protein [Skermanella pratensis]|uniref:Fic family protein n=1 Tax=Skermanella pratensis TaxID=2233999 RepID=UPI0013010C30|nr:Fic family protein [Skermanella pratensis]